MLDLDNPEVTLPSYVFKAKGKEYTYDLLTLGYRLRSLEKIEDPEKILAVVVKEFGLEELKLSAFEACLILDDFRKFAEEEADEPLKKVFGRSLFSPTTTDSPQAKSES
ncbi:hypothetical protein LCGC14_0965960 [marine sediment metagenome]|uniref:Uncharacterized protein n=1 Tax=marine sediment metagenome TaxID=412755 RepID=A0A0F9QWB5_9ZZZZ